MNPALKNESIREQFKLDDITCEEDLHEYKNLLNAMAALFYTNHRMQDVTILFYLWKEAAIALQVAKKNSNKKNIEIDTELANQEVF